MIREMLQDFRVSAEKIATEIQAAYQTEQWTIVGATAHKLKSSARSVGALALGELCADIERAGKASDVTALKELLPRFNTEMAIVAAYLDNLRKEVD